ncbi:BtpA/SgcQ family protein [archaeon]|nr:BtpA/SgcQ family protein [archaeon]
MWLRSVFGVDKPVIAVVHLPPLPGSGLYKGVPMDEIVEYAVSEARKLVDAGIDGVIVENFGDMTYAPGRVGPELPACMAVVVREVRRLGVPTGVCLLTDPIAGLAVAKAAGAAFVRATVYTEAVMDVSGIITGCAHELLRFRKLLDATDIRILADVQVKHSRPLAAKPLELSAIDAAYFQADAIIVTGEHTGFETPLEAVQHVREALAHYRLRPHVPVFVGSGVTAETLEACLHVADGVIVGSFLKMDGVTTNPIDEKRLQQFMEAVRRARIEGAT